MSVRRFDRGGLEKPVRDPVTGYMKVDAYLTRTGIFLYERSDGSTVREYRPPREVFDPASLASFHLRPFTNDHPSTGLLDASNTREHQRGTVESPRQDGDKVRASILVTDAQTIKEMEAGKVELSNGYTCDLVERSGEIDGQRYDAIQTNIRGNHVALVVKGRAGPETRLRMDATAAVQVTAEPDEPRAATDAVAEARAKFNAALFGKRSESPLTLDEARAKFNAALFGKRRR